MGKYDSSKHRVPKVFDKLRDRDPTGRTWLATLLGLPERPGRAPLVVDPNTLGTITRGALNSTPSAPGALQPEGWSTKEVSLSAPHSLLLHLVEHMQDPTSQKAWGAGEVETKRHLLRAGDVETRREASEYLTGARTSSAHRSRWEILEGPTRPDVYLETPTAVIVIEGKFTESAPTTKTTWMATRSQMLRHIDAAWDRRGDRQVYGFFIVESATAPGWVRASEATIAPEMVSGSLPHRSAVEQAAISDAFLGVTTWTAVCTALGLDASLLESRAQIDAGHATKRGIVEGTR